MKRIFGIILGSFLISAALTPFPTNAEEAPSAAPVEEVKKIENKSKAWIKNRGDGYTKQLQQIGNQRRMLEESLKEHQAAEAGTKAKIEELESLYKQMEKDGLWIVDSKLAAGK